MTSISNDVTLPDPASIRAPATGAVRSPAAFFALYRLVIRQQLTRGRLLLFAVVTAVSLLLGWAMTLEGSDDVGAIIDVFSAIGMGLIVPLVALVVGTSVLGNWVEDETLVYVWLRPVSRWVLALAAALGAVTVALPVIVGSTVAMAAIGSGFDGQVMAATAISGALGGLAYVTLFVAFGLIVPRALIWGLIYVFIWEFFVARAGAGAARFSINSYASSLLARYSDYDIRLADRALGSSYTVLIGVTVLSIVFATWRLRRANVA